MRFSIFGNECFFCLGGLNCQKEWVGRAKRVLRQGVDQEKWDRLPVVQCTHNSIVT